MKKGLIAIGVIILLLFIGGSVTWSHRNTAVDMEETINAQYAANKSNYDAMWKSFIETAQVSDKQANDMKKVYSDLISGRYGKDNNVLVKMVKEDNPKMDTGLYKRLMEIIESGRAQFDRNQEVLADKIREYNTYIRQKIVMTLITGRKTMDINKFMVTSARTSNAFSTGQDDAINISGNSK